MNPLIISLIAKFLIAGCLVVVATWFAAKGKTLSAALVGVFPFITFFTIVFTYFETKDTEYIATLASHFGWMLFATAAFPFTLALFLRAEYSLWLSLFLSLLITIVVQAIFFQYLDGLR